ncbi:MAG: hypothetical protein JWO33_629 [Caulobacteraceae bacterium]|nr:hypothetical protein [Caulobacteraceae bacterium]
MNRRYAPSPTLLLNLGVIAVAALVATTSATPARLAPAPLTVSGSRTVEEIQLQSPARFRLGVGQGRELPAGSRWRAIGSLAQGTVYRPLNLVFMMEGQRPDEAYPVVKAGKLQGFFLPAGATFAPVLSAVQLPV